MPRLEFGWTCALLSPEGGVCVRWCNVVPFQAAGQGISREDSAAQPGAERLQAAFRPRRNSQPSRADGVLLGSGPAPRFSCTWTVRVSLLLFAFIRNSQSVRIACGPNTVAYRRIEVPHV